MSKQKLLAAVLFGFISLGGAGCSTNPPSSQPVADSAQPAVQQDSAMPAEGSTNEEMKETPSMEGTEHATTDPAMAEAPDASTTTTTDPASDPATTDNQEQTKTSEVKEFNVTAKQWEFIPGTITVNEGDTVLLHVTSADVAHGLAISAFGVNQRVEPGQTVDIQFVADKKGSFTMFCSVFCGAGHGSMKGTLIVQ